MPELSDENIQKVKEQLQNLGQKAREAIGPEKAAAISASVPVVKSVARGVAIRSLRAVQTLCAAGAEKLEEGARPRAIEAADDFDDELLTEAPAPRPSEEPRPAFTPEPGPQPRTEPELAREFEIPHREVPPQPQPRPARSMPTEKTPPEIIRPKSTTHARRTFTYFGVVLALLAAGALVFSGVTLIRILRPRFGPPTGPKSVYEPVRRVQNNGPVTVVKLDRSGFSDQKTPNKPAAANQPVVEQKLPEKVKINYAGVNVRDDHSTQGTKIIGKAAKGEVKLLEFWEGKDQYPWYRIEAKNVTGWVYGRYVDVPPPPSPKADPKAPALNDGERMGRINHTGVNIRSDHSTKNTRVLTKMSNKDVVILGTWQGDGSAVPWYKIRLDNGGEGWIYGKYVELK